jgi:hypothetical protein
MKFKVGDRVKVVGNKSGIITLDLTGKVGTIVRIAGTSHVPYGVCFDEYVDGHNCFDTCKDGYGWNLAESDLTLIKPATIVIYQKNETVVAKNTATGEKAVAKCHPDDEFDFKVGAGVAFDRLMGREVEELKEEPKKFNGKLICVKSSKPDVFTVGKIYEVKDNEFRSDRGYEPYYYSGGGKCVIGFDSVELIEIVGDVETPKKEEYYNGKVVCTEGIVGLTTKGKIYEFKDGRLTYDDGDKSTSDGIHTFEDVCRRFTSNFIELHEDKPELYNGKVVCVDTTYVNNGLTVGKIYNIADGYLTDDDGAKRPSGMPPVNSLEELGKIVDTKFIEVVE